MTAENREALLVSAEPVGAVMLLRGNRHLSSATTPEQVAKFQKDNPAGWEFAGWLYTTPPSASSSAAADMVPSFMPPRDSIIPSAAAGAVDDLIEELEIVARQHDGLQNYGDACGPRMTARVCREAIAALTTQGEGRDDE